MKVSVRVRLCAPRLFHVVPAILQVRVPSDSTVGITYPPSLQSLSTNDSQSTNSFD